MFPGSARNFEICPKPTPSSRTKKTGRYMYKTKTFTVFFVCVETA